MKGGCNVQLWKCDLRKEQVELFSANFDITVSVRAVQNNQRKSCVHNDVRHMHTPKKSVKNGKHMKTDISFISLSVIITSCSIVRYESASGIACHIGKYIMETIRMDCV